jgi:hypothetical protein
VADRIDVLLHAVDAVIDIGSSLFMVAAFHHGRRDCASGRARGRCNYNLERPHESLGMQVPASRYRPSPRCFPESLPPVEYDSKDVIRKVQAGGEIWFKARPYKIGVAFRGHPVALRPIPSGDSLDVFFCHQKIAQINQNPSPSPSPKEN